MAIPERVARVLAQHGLTAVEFAAGSTHSARAAAQQQGVDPARIAKSILLRGADERFVLVVCRGNCTISMSKVRRLMGVAMRLATADEVRTATELAPGSVCPFGVGEHIAIVIDGGLAHHATIYPAAGSDSSSVELGFDKLVAITAGQIADVVREDTVSGIH